MWDERAILQYGERRLTIFTLHNAIATASRCKPQRSSSQIPTLIIDPHGRTVRACSYNSARNPCPKWGELFLVVDTECLIVHDAHIENVTSPYWADHRLPFHKYWRSNEVFDFIADSDEAVRALARRSYSCIDWWVSSLDSLSDETSLFERKLVIVRPEWR